jgi:hypothetical protein
MVATDKTVPGSKGAPAASPAATPAASKTAPPPKKVWEYIKKNGLQDKAKKQ